MNMIPARQKAGFCLRATEKSISEDRIVLGMLQLLERNTQPTHRSLANELGIALGLTNTYLRRCVTKGLLKVRATPARRYAYFITPRGFAEKARLTAHFLSDSLALFRRARGEYGDLLGDLQRRDLTPVALLGLSDLTEIAILCAIESEIPVAGIVEAATNERSVLGVPVFRRAEALPPEVRAGLVTDIRAPQEAYDHILRNGSVVEILYPELLGIMRRPGGSDVPAMER